MIINGLVWSWWSVLRKWQSGCLKPAADNGQFFEIPVSIYCGIQWKLLSSPAFKLHNLTLAQSSFVKQCHSKGRGHCLSLKSERIGLLAGQGKGTFQGMVADPGMLLNFLVIATCPTLPVACLSKIRIREIKKYYFKPCSAHLHVRNQTFLMSDDQEKITFGHFISPLVNETSLAALCLFYWFDDFFCWNWKKFLLFLLLLVA